MHFFDLSNNELKVVSWEVSDSIKHLILVLLERTLDSSLFSKIKYEDSINLSLRKCELCCAFYDLEDKETPNGIGHIDVVFDLTILGSKHKYVIENLDIKMSIKDNYNHILVDTRLFVEWATLAFFDSKNSEGSRVKYKYADYFKDSNDFDFSPRYFIINKRPDRDYIYLNEIIYKDKCHYILHNSKGIRIFEKSEFISTKIINIGGSKIEINGYASMYTHGEYRIIVTDAGYRGIKLIVLRPNNKSIGIWKIEDKSWDCTTGKWIYNYYYDALYDRLIFLSHDMKCLFFIDMRKVEEALEAPDASECSSKSHRNINDVGAAFDLNKSIISAINKWYKVLGNGASLYITGILGHYFDEKIRRLYIVARYNLQWIEYIGLFEILLKEQIEINLVSHTASDLQYILSHTKFYTGRNLKGINKKSKSLFKWGFHKLYDVTAKDLDLYYDNDNRFISIKYNRRSNKLVSYSDKYHVNIDLSFNIWNMIIILYECAEPSASSEIIEDNLGFYCKNSYGFILSDLNLVRKVPIAVQYPASSQI